MARQCPAPGRYYPLGQPDFDQDIHGFNFMAQVYGSTAVNGVWVLPGSHKTGKVDIKALVARSGSERIDGTVLLIAMPVT